ncbi:hypothetical protein SAMN05443246_0445 [Paenibacillus sp. GP183]|nr:hypothetical protein SAMN05443246_0445 [Paenibacillus sp. GP183]
MGNIENLIMNFLMFLFSKHRSNIFTSFNQSEYYQAVNKLKEHGISYRSRITSHDTGIMSSNRNDNSQYDIYVKKGEEYFAEKALSKY